VWHHDYLFWCGDFNYRIDLSKEEVIDLVQHENFEGLQMYDQLTIQRQNGSVIITLLKQFSHHQRLGFNGQKGRLSELFSVMLCATFVQNEMHIQVVSSYS